VIRQNKTAKWQFYNCLNFRGNLGSPKRRKREKRAATTAGARASKNVAIFSNTFFLFNTINQHLSTKSLLSS